MKRPILLFDSGVGGVSTLKTLIDHYPEGDFIFFGDHKNAPYGTKTPEELEGIIIGQIASLIADFSPLAVVIACNTATSVAINTLREQFSIPIFGLEPALKLAMDDSEADGVAVLATPVTLKGEKFKTLQSRYPEQPPIPIPAPGLMELVETALLEQPQQIQHYLENLLKPVPLQKLSHLVLGCTHYIFIKKILRSILPESVKIVDGNSGLARHLINTLGDQLKGTTGSIQFLTSGDQSEIPKMEAYLHFLQNVCPAVGGKRSFAPTLVSIQ